MSHVTHPKLPLTAQVRSHRLVVLAALLALAATIAVVLVFAITHNASETAGGDRAQPVTRTDGGPEESAVAAAVGSQPTVVRPDESSIAAAIGSAHQPAPAPARPDESTVATAISGR